MFVVKDERAHRSAIEAGLQDRDALEIRKGVVEGDLVIIAGQAGLKDNSLVKAVAEGSDQTTGEAERAGDGP